MSRFDKMVDTFNLCQTKLFDEIKKSLPSDKKFTRNLIECNDDMLFVWNAIEMNIMVLNWRMACLRDGKEVNYQTLVPSTPINYNVEKILPSAECNFIAYTGRNGVSILELPRRLGASGQYQKGKETIMCRSYNLDEKFMQLSNLEILQVKWHPASPNDSHLLVLMSNNSIRVYNESTLKHVWRVGVLPSLESTLPTLGSIGETAVDFDIGQPYIQENLNDAGSLSTTVESDQMKIFKEPANRVIWPIVILRGNGNIYILITGLDWEKPQLQGPITIYPSSYDNYGVEYCSLLILPSLPLTVIMAENTGRLHHGILIETNDDGTTDFHEEENSLVDVNSSFKIHRSNWILNITEIVELEMGFLSKTTNKDKRAECPIHLKRNMINEFQYFAYHNYGLHAVTVVFIKELENYVMSESENCEKSITFNTPSYCEYLVSTKVLQTNELNPVFGLTFTQSPSGLILLLSSGQIVTLDLISDINLIRNLSKNLNKMDSSALTDRGGHGDITNLNDSQLKKIIQDSFQTRIVTLLKSGNQQLPILKLNHAVEPTQQDLFKFLLDTTQILTEQVFPKHEKIKQEFNKRLIIMQRFKDIQIQDINNLKLEVEKIRDNAERLAEKYEEVNDRQTVLFRQAMNLVRLSSSILPILSTNEKDFCNEIKVINQQTQELVNKVLQVKTKIKSKDNQIENWNSNSTIQPKQRVLSQAQEQLFHDSLSKINIDIDEQIKEVKKIKEMLNIS